MNLAIIKVLIQQLVNENSIQLFGSSEDQFEECLNVASDNGDEEMLNILMYVEKQDLKGTYFKDNGPSILTGAIYGN